MVGHGDDDRFQGLVDKQAHFQQLEAVTTATASVCRLIATTRRHQHRRWLAILKDICHGPRDVPEEITGAKRRRASVVVNVPSELGEAPDEVDVTILNTANESAKWAMTDGQKQRCFFTRKKLPMDYLVHITTLQLYHLIIIIALSLQILVLK